MEKKVHTEVDICLIVEGGYPYTVGGVASWVDSFVQSFPELKFHVMALCTSTTRAEIKYPARPNVVALTNVDLDRCPKGRAPTRRDGPAIARWSADLGRLLTDPDLTSFARLMGEFEQSGLGSSALLESRVAWIEMERAYDTMMPGSSLVDFFWTWRNFGAGFLAIAGAKIPRARIYHTVSTGYAGVLGARAKAQFGRPLIVTEHGIYTNERRMDIAMAEWLYASGAGGFDASGAHRELHDLWLSAFQSASRIAYESADVITTQYLDNQLFQRNDGAPAFKQRMIPNGIDVSNLIGITHDPAPRRPTVALLGRVVPIKDVRTYILAAAELQKLVPDVEALIIGPEDEDSAYAEECRELVVEEGLEGVVRFTGRVPDVKVYFPLIDIIVLTSISEAQPLALLEAGAAGLPAVTSDVGSCREIIEGLPDEPGREPGGIVVPACDPKATAIALAQLLQDAPLRARMAAAMRRRVSTHYNKTRIDALYRDLYRAVVTMPAASPPRGV